MPFLEKEFPRLAENYRRRYQDHAFLTKSYHQRISKLMASLRRKYGIGSDYGRERASSKPQVEECRQLVLFRWANHLSAKPAKMRRVRREIPLGRAFLRRNIW